MNNGAWDDVLTQEIRRLRWKVKLLHHKVERRDKRIQKLYAQLRDKQQARP